MKAASNRKTKLCCIHNIRFFLETRELHYHDPNLTNAEQNTWTFKDQKKDENNVTITQDNNNDPLMKPVRSHA